MTESRGDDARRPVTYRAAGVDIDAAESLVGRFRALAASTARPEVVSGVGGFAGMFRVPGAQPETILLAAADGVGTKLLLAREAGRLEGAGRDLVAMNVNDILVYGAEPWFFLDYLAMGRLRPDQAEAVVSGIAAACREAGCALLGGETAELPGMMGPDDMELAGFAVGGVAAGDLIDGRSVEPGDVIVGLASSGLHSNGFSLARRVLLAGTGWTLATEIDELEAPLGTVLLEPTRLYTGAVKAARGRFSLRAMAHITGGGLTDNVARTLPPGTRARLHAGSWPEPPIFRLIRRLGPVEEEEMRRTFNLGIGFTVVVPAAQAQEFCAAMAPLTGGAWPIGVVEEAPPDSKPEVIWS